MKLPAFQFYPGDWLRDSVSGCSLAAQGLWLRLMLLMHDSERYGYLCNNGSPIPSAQLARRCGCTLAEFEELIAELESAGVPGRTRDGIIYSRRMSRDAEAREEWKRLAEERLQDESEILTWHTKRKLILKRDQDVCGYCGSFADTVDHILPKARGGTDAPSNLIAACRSCNFSKNDRTPEEMGFTFIDGRPM